MSAGTPRYTVRIPNDLMHQVHEQILSRNAISPLEEWDLSEFIVLSIREKLAKMARSRRPGRRRKVRAAAQSIGSERGSEGESPSDPECEG